MERHELDMIRLEKKEDENNRLFNKGASLAMDTMEDNFMELYANIRESSEYPFSEEAMDEIVMQYIARKRKKQADATCRIAREKLNLLLDSLKAL